MSNRIVSVCLAICLSLCITSVTAPRVAAQDASVAFQEKFGEWKVLLKKLRDLRMEYEIAEKEKLPDLTKQWDETIKASNDLIPILQANAKTAFSASPNTDRELTRFLLALTYDELQSDNQEKAMELAQVLLDGECEDKNIYNFAGVAAFCTNQYEKAGELFKKADEAGIISDMAKQYQGYVEPYIEYWAEEQEIRKKEAEADDLPRVRFKTSQGDIVLELFENEAPESVGNFINLVEKGFYDGLSFHRVLQAFMTQAGCPTGDGSGGPGYDIYCECYQDNARKHFRGSISMAHAGRDTGGSQFFLMLRPDSPGDPSVELNGKHTVFGRIIEGMEVLSKIKKRDPSGGPQQLSIIPDVIEKAEVIRKRDHKYVPNKVR